MEQSRERPLAFKPLALPGGGYARSAVRLRTRRQPSTDHMIERLFNFNINCRVWHGFRV
jgi:hypothetical protein